MLGKENIKKKISNDKENEINKKKILNLSK